MIIRNDEKKRTHQKMRIVYKPLTRSNGIIRAVKLKVDILSGTGHSNHLELGCDHELTKGANQIEIYKNKKNQSQRHVTVFAVVERKE